MAGALVRALGPLPPGWDPLSLDANEIVGLSDVRGRTDGAGEVVFGGLPLGKPFWVGVASDVGHHGRGEFVTRALDGFDEMSVEAPFAVEIVVTDFDTGLPLAVSVYVLHEALFGTLGKRATTEWAARMRRAETDPQTGRVQMPVERSAWLMITCLTHDIVMRRVDADVDLTVLDRFSQEQSSTSRRSDDAGEIAFAALPSLKPSDTLVVRAGHPTYGRGTLTLYGEQLQAGAQSFPRVVLLKHDGRILVDTSVADWPGFPPAAEAESASERPLTLTLQRQGGSSVSFEGEPFANETQALRIDDGATVVFDHVEAGDSTIRVGAKALGLSWNSPTITVAPGMDARWFVTAPDTSWTGSIVLELPLDVGALPGDPFLQVRSIEDRGPGPRPYRSRPQTHPTRGSKPRPILGGRLLFEGVPPGRIGLMMTLADDDGVVGPRLSQPFDLRPGERLVVRWDLLGEPAAIDVGPAGDG